ncbi:MAG: hypothetical protein NZ557_02005, partial [Chthonomonadaceae bacterium]|nr:hypothetical protein [Chthonomonadaceae bacterium]
RRLAREFQARLRAQLEWVAEELATIPSAREELEGAAGAGEAVVGTGEIRTVLHGTQSYTAYSLKTPEDDTFQRGTASGSSTAAEGAASLLRSEEPDHLPANFSGEPPVSRG